jgi:hypothetical protein
LADPDLDIKKNKFTFKKESKANIDEHDLLMERISEASVYE